MIYQVIFDTNVLVAAFRSRLGASYKLMTLIEGGRFKLNLSVPLLFEYEAILKNDAKISGLSKKDVEETLDYLCQTSRHHKISYLWRPYLKVPKDDFVLELAVAAGCDFIVTFNKKDFVGSEKFGVKIVSPQEFLKIIGEIK